MDPITLLCPGQGAQTPGMGNAWIAASPEAKAVFDQADAILDDRLGAPLSTLCFEGPSERLGATDAAQPALFVTAIASAHALCAQWGVTLDTLPLTAAAGLSLGEYTALHLAGAIDFEPCLELVALRGRAMQDAATATPSGMVALIGADEDQANQLCDHAREADILQPANFNAPGQIVISGSAAACERATAAAEDFKVRATPLQVAGAFHSPLMQPAAERLAETLAETDLRTPRAPVISNVTAKPHEAADTIRARLVEQLTAPVRWADSCLYMAEHAQLAAPHELAPGKTLAGLMRRIDRAIKVTTHDAP